MLGITETNFFFSAYIIHHTTCSKHFQFFFYKYKKEKKVIKMHMKKTKPNKNTDVTRAMWLFTAGCGSSPPWRWGGWSCWPATWASWVCGTSRWADHWGPWASGSWWPPPGGPPLRRWSFSPPRRRGTPQIPTGRQMDRGREVRRATSELCTKTWIA